MDMQTEAEHIFDVVVIGSGPGGEGAAMHCAKNGRRVAMIERAPRVGGACTHQGTIPSKVLRYAITQLQELNQSSLLRDRDLSLQATFGELLRGAHRVIDAQVEMRRTFYERNRVPVFHGHARLLDAHTVVCEDETGGNRLLSASAIFLATGARPYRPHDVDFQSARVFDSDSILTLRETPQSITIYGAGVVGCEYASMFRNLGVKVNLVHSHDRLLDFLDDEIADALSYHLRERGVLIRHRETAETVQSLPDGVVLHLKSGKQLKTDILLWANGRTGNSQGMGLEPLGILPDSRGYVPVNENFQTAVPHLYAVGDLIGFPSLASAAYTQGRMAARHLVDGATGGNKAQDIPTGIYTSPEISSVGRTERELTEASIPYEVGHALFKSLARAQILGRTTGMLKLLFHRETLEILGIHCFGANAAEIIHIGQAIMAQPRPQNSLHYFINTTFNYPTMAEAYRVAALNGYNRLF